MKFLANHKTINTSLSHKKSISKTVIESNKKVVSDDQQFCQKHFNLAKMQQIHEENILASL